MVADRDLHSSFTRYSPLPNNTGATGNHCVVNNKKEQKSVDTMCCSARLCGTHYCSYRNTEGHVQVWLNNWSRFHEVRVAKGKGSDC